MQLLGAKNEKWLPSVIWKFGPHSDQKLTLGPKTALKWRREAKDGPNATHLVYPTCFGPKKKDFEMVTSNPVLLAWNCPIVEQLVRVLTEAATLRAGFHGRKRLILKWLKSRFLVGSFNSKMQDAATDG